MVPKQNVQTLVFISISFFTKIDRVILLVYLVVYRACLVGFQFLSNQNHDKSKFRIAITIGSTFFSLMLTLENYSDFIVVITYGLL